MLLKLKGFRIVGIVEAELPGCMQFNGFSCEKRGLVLRRT